MAIKRYLFSARQKRMRDILGGGVTRVNVDGVWKEYTQCVVTDELSDVWGDFVVVAEGAGLETTEDCSNASQQNVILPVRTSISTGVGVQ